MENNKNNPETRKEMFLLQPELKLVIVDHDFSDEQLLEFKEKWERAANEKSVLIIDSLEFDETIAFNSFKDITKLLSTHPDKEMVTQACLHFLGDGTQK